MRQVALAMVWREEAAADGVAQVALRSLLVDVSQIGAAALAGIALLLNLKDRVERDRPNLRILSGRVVLGRPVTEKDPVIARGSTGPARLVNFGGGPAANAVVSVDSVVVTYLGQYWIRPNHSALHNFDPVDDVDLGMLPMHGPFLLLPNVFGSVDPLPSSLAERIGAQIYAVVPEPFPMGYLGPVSRFDPQIEFRANVQATVTYRDRTERRQYSQQFTLMMVGSCSFLGTTQPGRYRVVAYLMNASEADEDFILSRDERIMFPSQRDIPPEALM